MNAVTPIRKSKLLAVSPDTVEPKKPKILIFGPAGVGKTWAALDFPGVYYIDTEGGADLGHYRERLKAAGDREASIQDHRVRQHHEAV
jgi:hypothetical protein